LIKTVGPLILAFFLAFLGTPLVRRFAWRIKAVDRPNSRKVHNRLMPRLGGIAICLGYWVTIFLTGQPDREIIGMFLGGLIIVALGILDDTRGLSPRIKLLGQILAACIAIAWGVRVDFLTHPFEGVISLEIFGLGFVSYLVTIVWIVGITNAVNLIDGLDGLAAGVSAIAAITLGVVSLLEGFPHVASLAFILAASTLGFLKYNFYPAKVFMGDTGSLFLGFNLATIAVIGLTKSATVISLFLPVVILGIPIADTFLAIVRRYFNGKSIFSPDKDHIHHRLLAIGLSHRRTVLAIYVVSAILGVSAVLTALVATPQGVLIMLITTGGVFFAADKVGILRTRDFEAKNQSGKESLRGM
jgi:UDP-GlcNAc:undecaprenyl-phosphate GlcNAc-1-phosphate transferase